MKIKRRVNASGFTLIELMIALLVATLVIVGYIGTNIVIQRHAEEIHERTIATQDANRTIEQMRNMSRNGTFPANVVNSFPDDTAVTGFNNLTDEEVTVSYVSTTADPLDVTVTVTWLSYTQRQSTVTIRTYITQR